MQNNSSPGAAGSNKHKALITYCEGCWITSLDPGGMTADGGVINQSIEANVTDVHDLYSTYGEFMATGDDPTMNQNSSLLYGEVRRGADRNRRVNRAVNPT